MLQKQKTAESIISRVTVMTTVVLSLLVVLSLTGCRSDNRNQGFRTVVIGLDGGTWNILAPLIKNGELPNFSRMVKGGTYGTMLVDPPYSPPSWTSLATGDWPSKHGVTEFVHKTYPDSTSPIYKLNPTRADMVKRKRIWNILNDNGLTTGVLYWLFTWPIERVNGVMISDYRGKAFDNIKGRDLQSDVYHAFVRKRWLDKSLRMTTDSRRALSPAELDPRFAARDKLVLDAFLKVEQKLSTARYILREYPDLDYFSISFYWGNDLQHKFLHYALNPDYYGVPPAEKERYKDVIPMFYRNLDQFLGEILDDPATKNVAIISDHGMELINLDAETYLRCYHFILNFDRILEILGYRKTDPVSGKTDWTATRAYTCLYKRTEFGVALNLKGREETGIVNPRHADALLDSLTADLAKVKFAGSEEPLWGQVVRNPEGWPDLIFKDYYRFKYADVSKVLNSRIVVGDSLVDAGQIIGYPGYMRKGEHGYDFDGKKPYAEYGIIFLYGPPFRKGFKLEDRSFRTIDFLPTLLYALDLPVAEDMDGHVVTDVFKPSFRRGNPVKTIPSYENNGHRRLFITEEVTERNFDTEEIEKLRSLGYVR